LGQSQQQVWLGKQGNDPNDIQPLGFQASDVGKNLIRKGMAREPDIKAMSRRASPL